MKQPLKIAIKEPFRTAIKEYLLPPSNIKLTINPMIAKPFYNMLSFTGALVTNIATHRDVSVKLRNNKV